MTSNYDAVLARLEKAVQQIESYASKAGSNLSTAIHNATHSADAEEDTQAMQDWHTLTAAHLAPFIAAANRLPETKRFVRATDRPTDCSSSCLAL